MTTLDSRGIEIGVFVFFAVAIVLLKLALLYVMTDINKINKELKRIQARLLKIELDKKIRRTSMRMK